MGETNQSLLLNIQKFIHLVNVSSLTEEINYFKNKIKEDVGPLNYKTNVKGEMTLFKQYVKDPYLGRIIKYLLPRLDFESLTYCLKKPEKIDLLDCWGNILNKGDKVEKHNHLSSQFNSVLYLNESSIVIEGHEFFTKKGDVLTMPGNLNHHVNPSNINNRITLVWNWNVVYPGEKWDDLSLDEDKDFRYKS